MFRGQTKVSTEVVAAITAAVNLMMEEGSRFEIRDIRPMAGMPAVSLWSKVGLMDLMRGRAQASARVGR